MNRLTIKDKEIRDNFNAEYAKLADLEDIEEELGIDLITMFNKYIKWHKLDTYNTKENDWVLVLCKDKMKGLLYALPLIAELRNDGKWYTRDDKCVNDYLEIIAWKNIDVIYECGKLTEEYVNDNYVQRENKKITEM